MTEELLASSQNEQIANETKASIFKRNTLTAHPHLKRNGIADYKTTRIGGKKYKDTKGGFFIEDEQDKKEAPLKIVENLPLVFDPNRPTCKKCKKLFTKSYLFDTFQYEVCDECKNPEEHRLITRTEAMKSYLLKENDIDMRNPSLKYISKKNPHNHLWGEMKLYLQIQVEKRALEVWGSEEKIQRELTKREEKQIFLKTKKCRKQMTDLRMSTRRSLYNKITSNSHTHKFDSEIYNADQDTYTHTCSCGYYETFEKM